VTATSSLAALQESMMLDRSAAPTCRFEGGVGGSVSGGVVSEQAAVALVSALAEERLPAAS